MNEKEILIKTLYFEAGSTQEIWDVLLIAWVIRNRVKQGGYFGKTYKEVCLKPYQFSCWNGSNYNKLKKMRIGSTWRWNVCRVIASYIMKAPEKDNPIKDVCFYYNDKLCDPKWAKKMVRTDPDLKLDHVFLKEKQFVK